jgi:hypothetical protein
MSEKTKPEVGEHPGCAPRPDLHALVAEHGGSFTAIPLDAWRHYDRAVEQWKHDLRTGKRFERK